MMTPVIPIPDPDHWFHIPGDAFLPGVNRAFMKIPAYLSLLPHDCGYCHNNSHPGRNSGFDDIIEQLQKTSNMNQNTGVVPQSENGMRKEGECAWPHPAAHADIIAKDIQAALHKKTDHHSASITVTTNGNQVTLDGWVQTRAEKDIAVYAASSARGVTNVIDNLKVMS